MGHLVPQKGFDILLRALAICCHAGGDRFRLAIVGKGYEQDALRSLAHELDLDASVEWLGAPERSTMPKVYRAADAFVLASRHESFGVVVIEATAMTALARRRWDRSAIRGYFESAYAAKSVVPRLLSLYGEVLASSAVRRDAVRDAGAPARGAPTGDPRP